MLIYALCARCVTRPSGQSCPCVPSWAQRNEGTPLASGAVKQTLRHDGKSTKYLKQLQCACGLSAKFIIHPVPSLLSFRCSGSHMVWMYRKQQPPQLGGIEPATPKLPALHAGITCRVMIANALTLSICSLTSCAGTISPVALVASPLLELAGRSQSFAGLWRPRYVQACPRSCY
jgi:hypothetical protein